MAGHDSTIDQLIDIYCAAWSDPDPARRRETLAGVWADGATYTDPSVHAVGLDELLAHIDAVVARRPGAKVVRTSRVDAHHDLARFAWRVVQADGTALPEGLDIAELSADGRIRRIVGFFGPLEREAPPEDTG
jgi:SnoaL-like domain